MLQGKDKSFAPKDILLSLIIMGCSDSLGHSSHAVYSAGGAGRGRQKPEGAASQGQGAAESSQGCQGDLFSFCLLLYCMLVRFSGPARSSPMMLVKQLSLSSPVHKRDDKDISHGVHSFYRGQPKLEQPNTLSCVNALKCTADVVTPSGESGNFVRGLTAL